MTIFSLLLQQIEEELGPDSQVPAETRPGLLALFYRDMEQQEAYRIILTEDERRQVYDLLSSLSIDAN